jgi:hypothetical protein
MKLKAAKSWLHDDTNNFMKTTRTLLGILSITAALAMNGRSQSCAPVTSGLVDWWPGNGNANDIVGTNNGTIPYSDVTFGPGEVGEAFVFSGHGRSGANDTGNEVDFGTNAGNFGTNDFTIDFWIKIPSNAPNVYAVLGKYPACNADINCWHIRIGPVEWTPPPLPGQLAFAIANNGEVLCHLQSTKTINDGIFHHVALIRHGVTYSFYIDGSPDSSVTAIGMADINNNATMRAGNSACVAPGVGGSDNTQPLVGELDELDLYNRALAPAEISAIYQAGSAGKCESPCAPVTLGLVDWWPGNGNANDIVGTNNGTIPDNVDVTFGPGEVGEGFVFSGISPGNNDTGNEVDFGTNAGNFGTNNFTIDFWIKQPPSATGLYGILEKRQVCNASLAFFDIHCGHESALPTTTPGRLSMDFAGNGDTDYALLIDTNKQINDGVFHHAAFVRNGLNLAIYVDGNLDVSMTTAGIANLTNADLFRAGQSVCVGTDGSQPFVGELDELDLYNRALAPAEIYAIYQAGSAGKCAPADQAPFTNSLVAYYPFNGNANDATGNGNNGTIVGNVVPATDRFGNPSGAYAFDGVSSSAIEVTNTLFNIGQPGYTISGWFAGSNVTEGTQVVIQTMPQAGVGIGFDNPDVPGGYLEFGVGPTGSWTDLFIHGDQPCTNQTWYQFVLTKSGTSYTLYTNGQVYCQQTVSAASGYNANVGCIIGSITPINPSYHETFLGCLDDFRIYNRALSSNEVQQLYAYESVPPPCSTPYPATATVTVVGGSVVAVTVTDGGCGYTNTPTVVIVGGGGTGAAATAVVSNGVVTGITITDGGSGYTNTPTVDIASPLSITAQAPFTDSLVAYYPFDGNANDATGNGNNGTIVGNVVPATDRFGNPSGAYAFDGVSSSAIEVTNTLFNIGQPGYTISGWFAGSNVTEGTQVVIQTMPQAGVGIGFDNPDLPGGYLEFGVGPTGSWTDLFIHGDQPCANQTWYQFVLTKSGTSYTLYTNGQVYCQQTISAASGYNANVGCIIGSITPINPPYHETFLGRLDDFRIYNRALSSSEVQQLYAYESVPESQAPFTNSLVAYYPFDGNANDATGNGNNGTIVGNVVPATDRFGNPSGAYAFDGVSSSAIEVTNTLFNIGQPGYTISGWFAGSNVTEGTQVVIQTMPQAGVGIGFDNPDLPGGYLEFGVGPTGSWTDLFIHGDQPCANQTWYQFVLTKSGTSYTLYTNGQVYCQQTISAASGYNANVGCIIGSITPINPPYHETFLGRLDDFRIYNRALSSSEVQQLYAYESAPPSCIPCPATATPTVVDGFVVAATVTDGGCCYTNPPPILIVGGGGTGATATAVVSNGVVIGITITDAGIGYTNTPAIYIYSPLFVTAQPRSLVVNAYDTASVSVAATGTVPLSYQWSLNGTNIPGATSSSMTISNVVQTNLGTYAVIVSDIFGSVTSSNAALFMYPFLEGPFSGAVTYWGKSATLSVNAWGTGLSYQWFDNGVAIPGATNSTLAFSSIQLTNAGLYSVAVRSPFGSVTNTPEQVVVNPAGVSLGIFPGVTISGVVGYSYIIQTTRDLSHTNSWVTLTNLTLTQPIQLWLDTNTDASLPANPLRYYQVLPGQ